jgi:hypothetical protein
LLSPLLKARGVKLGGTNRQSIENREAALARAEALLAAKTSFTKKCVSDATGV